MANKKQKVSDSEPWLTIGQVRELIAEARECNSTDTKITLHNCKTFDGVCIVLRIVDGHDICEEEEAG